MGQVTTWTLRTVQSIVELKSKTCMLNFPKGEVNHQVYEDAITDGKERIWRRMLGMLTRFPHIVVYQWWLHMDMVLHGML